MSTVTQDAPTPSAAARGSTPTPKAAPVALDRPSTAHIVAWGIAVVSGLALAMIAFLLVLSPLQQSRAQDVLYGQFRSELAAATAPFGVDPIEPGQPVAILDIGDIGLRQVVVEGTAGSDLQSGPGHERDTVLLGQVGTTVIAGRSVTYGGPFADITDLETGDPIRVVTGQGKFTYLVEDVRREGDPAPAALQAGQSRLVLITAEGNSLQPSSTVYVDALLQGDPTVTPPRPPVFMDPSELPMASDTSAMLNLVLWMLALVGVGCFVVWGVTRWGTSQTWVIGFPLALAALWGACDSAASLLPNLM